MECYILELPKDLLRLFVSYLKSHYDKRNFMVVCKQIYDSIPIHLRREHLFDLSAAVAQTIKTTKINGKGNKYCSTCATRYKHGHSCPGVLKKCFKCWGIYPLRAYHSCSGLKYKFMLKDVYRSVGVY